MQKNVKSIFLAAILFVLLVGVTSVSAGNVSDDATTLEDTNEIVASQEVATPTASDNSVETAKTIEKEDKQVKKDSITINGIEYTNVIENKETGGGFITSKTFINNCTLSGDYIFLTSTSYINNSICNLELDASEIYINNSVLNAGAYFMGQAYVYNTTMKGDIYNGGTLVLDDNSIIDPDATIDNQGSVISNNTYICYLMGEFNLENGILNDMSIDKPIKNNGNLTLHNISINSVIKNNGKLIITDNCTITDNFRLSGTGDVITNLTFSDDVYNLTKVIEVNNGNELSTAMENAYNDEYYAPYIINLNEGNYQYSGPGRTGKYRTNIIINANNQTITDGYGLSFTNACNNTLNQANVNTNLYVGGQGFMSSTPLTTLTLNQVTPSKNITIYANGALTIINSTISSNITNKGTLIISDDTVFDSTASLTSTGTLITNNTNLLYPYKDEFLGGTLKDMTIDKDITTNGNFTLQNVTVDKTIKNNGRLIIGDGVIFTENGKIIGMGEIITNNIANILPYTETINGNYTIRDVTLDKTYNFMGNITLDGCNITSTDNINYEILNIKNSNIKVADESTWITNNGLLIIDNSNTTGNMKNNREVYIDNLPEDYTYDNSYHVVNNDTAPLYFDTINGNVLNDLVNEGDTLDFQGTISGVPGLGSLVINKPVNIITTSNDGRIENFGSITYTNGASGSNITGLYTYNTQFYVRNAHDMVFNNISNVVNSKSIGWGVGQTSIRENSTNITVQNSYFYTKDNGGSSTFVFGWADNCTLYNSTIETDGRVGNLVYLTTYNVDVPSGVVPNSNNQILNNVIIGPTTPEAICWAIVLTGANNTIANNRIYYAGVGITNQWGSGIDGVMENETSLVTIENNTLTNNTHVKHKPQPEPVMEQLEYTIGENTTITANIQLVDEVLTDINNGKVCFKVNGKVLRDETTGKVIYADITDGKATIENVDTTNWNENTTIQAVVTGNKDIPTTTSQTITPTITYPEQDEPEFTVADTTATAGSEVTITVTTKNLDAGKVVLKVNGKTAKAADGKLYAKTNGDTTTFTYTVPKTYKAGEYSIKAVYTSGTTKLEAESKLTVE